MTKLRVIAIFSVLVTSSLLYLWMSKVTSSHDPLTPSSDVKKSRLFSSPTHYDVTNVTISRTVSNISDCRFDESAVEGELLKLCKSSETLSDDCVVTMGDAKVTFLEYKKRKGREFADQFSNPWKKTVPTPKLREFPDQQSQNVIKHPDEKINEDEIRRELDAERKRRLDLGDDDVTKIPEVEKELSTGRVPNIVHFVYFGQLKVRVFEYITFIAALRHQKPALILFHSSQEPIGEYWEAFKEIAGKKLKVVKRSPPLHIWGNVVNLVEHRADVARLQIMMEVGGIYLDTDSVVLTSLDVLMDNDMVLGEESGMDLANGVILAKRDTWFLKRWFWEYKYFNDAEWGTSSVIAPWGLWKLFRDEIHVVKQKICRPNWEELTLLFHELIQWEDHYIMHLYSRFMKQYDGKNERPIKELAVLNTTYGAVARHALWGNSRVRDVTEWVVTCDLKQRLISEYYSSAPTDGS